MRLRILVVTLIGVLIATVAANHWPFFSRNFVPKVKPNPRLEFSKPPDAKVTFDRKGRPLLLGLPLENATVRRCLFKILGTCHVRLAFDASSRTVAASSANQVLAVSADALRLGLIAVHHQDSDLMSARIYALQTTITNQLAQLSKATSTSRALLTALTNVPEGSPEYSHIRSQYSEAEQKETAMASTLMALEHELAIEEAYECTE